MVAKPFLKDYISIHELKTTAGPVHLIVCHLTATEMEAIPMLSFPDATVACGDFGINVADDVQKVQFIFLKNCRDDSTLMHEQQRFSNGWIRPERMKSWRGELYRGSK